MTSVNIDNPPTTKAFNLNNPTTKKLLEMQGMSPEVYISPNITNLEKNKFFTVISDKNIYKVYYKIRDATNDETSKGNKIVHGGKVYELHTGLMDNLTNADKTAILKKLNWQSDIDIEKRLESVLTSDIALDRSVISPLSDNARIKLEHKQYSLLKKSIDDKLEIQYSKDTRSNKNNNENGTPLHKKNRTPMIELLMVLYKNADLTPQLSSIRDTLIVPSEYNTVTKMYKDLTTTPEYALNSTGSPHKNMLSFILSEIQLKSNKYVKPNTDPYKMMDDYIKKIVIYEPDTTQNGGKSKKHHIHHKQRKPKTRKQHKQRKHQ